MLLASSPERMSNNLEFYLARERLSVGRRFLMLRPLLVALGGLANGACLALSSAPLAQKRVLALAMFCAWLAFGAEALWLRTRALSERWLLSSLTLTVCALSTAALLSGALSSPLLPLLFAPSVVGFAAFARGRASGFLFALTLAALGALALVGPLQSFPVISAPWSFRIVLISSALSFALLFVGVVGLVDAHARVAEQLERMRADLLREVERRAVSMEALGAQVAHDVKNPLTAVRGLVQLVQRKADDERDRERLSVVVDQVDRALSLLHDYLSFARPLSDLSLSQVDLRALLEDVAAVLEARALERGVSMSVEGEQVSAVVDRQRLRDALLNLALNGITAMPDGGALRMRVFGEPRRVRIELSDTGLGMDADELAKLGSAFNSGSEGGTGLGVLLARAVLAQHGGALSYESARGQGTCAKLELPRGGVSKPAAPPAGEIGSA
jgi:signal transduction histidine kinase